MFKNNVYEFATKVDQDIENLSDNDYRLRKGRAKVLREELLPISRLALALKIPGLSIEVEGYEDNRAADGHIRINGYRTESFEVEVTCTHKYKEHLHAELLNKDGHCPGAGSIKRDSATGEIIAVMQAVDSNAYIHDIATDILDAIARKAGKSYPSGTVLIIAFSNVKLVGHGQWHLLHKSIADKGGIPDYQFTKLYFFNAESNELIRFS